MGENCHYVKLGYDYYQVCQPESPKPESVKPAPEKAKTEEDEGSWWGKMWCDYKCQNFDKKEYDMKTGKCECKGDYRPPLWYRR